LCGSCQGTMVLQDQKRHDPFTQEILNKTQVCNYGQVIAISFFIFHFNVKLGLSKALKYILSIHFFGDVKSKIILKATLSK
jgi:hypothetical protein